MFAILAIVVMVWLSMACGSVTNVYERLTGVYESRYRQLQMIRLAESVNQFYSEKGSHPATLAALTGTAGFQHAAGYLNNWQGYALSPSIADTNWTFRRAVLLTSDPTRGINTTAHLSANACGTGGYAVAASWCGAKDSFWFRHETRDVFADLIVTERARVNRLSQKFANYYNAYAAYPSQDAANVNLAADSITSLADLVGYSGTANSCTGQFHYKGIPIDCSDMFNSWGMRVAYQFITAKRIILVSETPIVNALGVTIIIAVDRA